MQRKDIIRDRLEKEFQPLQLQVIDESDKHIGHAGHQGGNRHFAIIISAVVFNEMSSVDAHRRIFALFADMIPDQIHALRISIVPCKK